MLLLFLVQKKIKYLEENVVAIKIHLSSEELSEIGQIINSIEITGTRNDDTYMRVRNHNYSYMR